MNTQSNLSQSPPRLFLDEPIYRFRILASFLDPFWFRRILLGAGVLTVICLIAVLVGWLFHLSDSSAIRMSLALVPFVWFGALVFFPLCISFLLRPLIFVQDDLFRALFRTGAD